MEKVRRKRKLSSLNCQPYRDIGKHRKGILINFVSDILKYLQSWTDYSSGGGKPGSQWMGAHAVLASFSHINGSS